MEQETNSQPFRRPIVRLSADLEHDLSRMNPWWLGEPAPPAPKTRRRLVDQIHRRLDMALAPIIAVRGPRQIGKSTAQMQVITDLLARGVPPLHIFRVQFDELDDLDSVGWEPVLRLTDWYEQSVLKSTINTVAHAGGKVYFFLDEVQNISGWHVQLKHLVDHTRMQVVLTGSSALRIELGRDSLAGRIHTLEAGPLSLSEIASFRSIPLGPPLLTDNGLHLLAHKETWLTLKEMGQQRAEEREQAFRAFAERGGYPIGHERPEVDWLFLADQLNETVIRRVLQHDLRAGDRGRKRDPKLLENLFRLACRYAGQAPSIESLIREVQRAQGASVGEQRARNYLRFLADTLLLRLIEPLELRLKRRQGFPKICLADHALRASWLGEYIPLTPEELAREPDLTVQAGRLAESIVGSTLSTIYGLDIAWQPERKGEPEVDFVLTIGMKRIPIEVKYQRRIDSWRDTEGLRAFIDQPLNGAPFGILITQGQAHEEEPRIVSLPLSTLMMVR